MFKLLIINLFIYFLCLANSAENRFIIFQKDSYTTLVQQIGEATFSKEHLKYNKLPVISYTIDLSFKNGGMLKREKFETYNEEQDLSLIYASYNDFDRIRVNSFRQDGDLYITSVVRDKISQSQKIKMSPGVFASSVLYLKLKKYIGVKTPVAYEAIDENTYTSYGIVKKGRFVYKGQEENLEIQGKKLIGPFHIFANSFNGDSEFVYYDSKKTLSIIKMLKPGLSIVFIRQDLL